MKAEEARELVFQKELKEANKKIKKAVANGSYSVDIFAQNENARRALIKHLQADGYRTRIWIDEQYYDGRYQDVHYIKVSW